ncbi:MAG: hypothetical protein ACKV1O_09100 [Saprospiraceae bacterium]
MIRINKSASVPAILSTTGIAETTALQSAYTASPNDYKSRVGVKARDIRKFRFDNSVYGHESVKQQLIADQHDKCCFCEAKFSDNSFGDVEHYRPKGAYKKKEAKSNTYPGYYWLAYDWNNLMYSCEKCNRKHKKNDYPLDDETTRKLFHNHANTLTGEERLLINPIEEDPSVFIIFKEEVPVPVNRSLKGATSIKSYGLERMNNSRLEYLKLLGGLLAFLEIDITNDTQVNLAMQMFNFTRQEVLDKVADATRFFNIAATDRGKFAHCVRCKFPHLPTI